MADERVDRGRIVVVAAGFGLWLGGRCLAAGKWSDIAGVRAYRRPGADERRVSVAVRLRDGSEVEMVEEAPGWMEFVSVAPSRLPGMPAPADWMPTLPPASEPLNETILFTRTSLG